MFVYCVSIPPQTIWSICIWVRSKNVNHDMRSVCYWFTGEHFYNLAVALNRRRLVNIFPYFGWLFYRWTLLYLRLEVWKVEKCHLHRTVSVLSCQKYLAWGPFLRASRFVDVRLSVRETRQTLYRLKTNIGVICILGGCIFSLWKREKESAKTPPLIWNYS